MGAKRKPQETNYSYTEFASINGLHPIQDLGPGHCINYRVRERANGRVAFFNFSLAKEMGLIPKHHPERVTPDLEKVLLDTFAVQIINEHDLMSGKSFSADQIKPNPFMATRYLQLQHPDKRGSTSGDGRSLWNGTFSSGGKTWDISSCGTGATCLSPATAIHKKFFRTGDPSVSYGCGYAEVSEGIGNAMYAEYLHQQGIPTERSLLVIEFQRGLAINVRAGMNLLRPSHFFTHLRQNNWARLKSLTKHYIDRHIHNGVLKKSNTEREQLNEFLTYVSRVFATMSARFESEYVFCWLDWDGDNILVDGGIIDYGSIRQFGLFHHEYRFDDVERWSTTIIEQKQKARYIVQNFAQMVDFLLTRKKKNIHKFSKGKALREFDRIFAEERKKMLVSKIGFTNDQVDYLVKYQAAGVDSFKKSFDFFERCTSTKGPVRLADGISTNAIFCMRDLLRELPSKFIGRRDYLKCTDLLAIMRSTYATRKDMKISLTRKFHANNLQKYYLQMADAVAKNQGVSSAQILAQLNSRSSVINRYERITGDGMIHVCDKLMQLKKKHDRDELYEIIRKFVFSQNTNPSGPKSRLKLLSENADPKSDIALEKLSEIAKKHRESL